MPPLLSTPSSVGERHFARCPPWYPQFDLSQRLHVTMSSLPSSSPPILAKAPLLHAPTPSLVAQAGPLQPTTAASITPVVYYSRPSSGTRTLLPDLPTRGPFMVFGQCIFDIYKSPSQLTFSLGQTTAMVPMKRTVTLPGSTPTQGKSSLMPVQPIYSVIWTLTGKTTKAMTTVSGHTNGASTGLASALWKPAVTPTMSPRRKLSPFSKRRSISSKPSLLIRFVKALIDIVRTLLIVRPLVPFDCWDCSFQYCHIHRCSNQCCS